jgi:uncharacterized membrane protein YcaP (DUF421 family)
MTVLETFLLPIALRAVISLLAMINLRTILGTMSAEQMTSATLILITA